MDDPEFRLVTGPDPTLGSVAERGHVRADVTLAPWSDLSAHKAQ